MKCIEIYQITDIENYEYAFCWWTETTQQKFDITNYKLVYREAVDNKPDNEICEELFERFNLSDSYYRQSVDYAGRSLSVSDVIKINDKYYFCDMCGFEDITKFVK